MNNSSKIMWAQLILDNQAKLEDVPAQLRDGVSEVVAYFTKTTQPTESKPATPSVPTQAASTKPSTDDAAKAVKAVDSAVANASK